MDPPEKLRITSNWTAFPTSATRQASFVPAKQKDARGTPCASYIRYPRSGPAPNARSIGDRHHADPHPGNVPVDTEGTVWLLGLRGGRTARSGIARGSAGNGHRLLGERRLGDRASGSPSRRRRPQRHAIPRARPLAVAGRGTGGAGMSPAVLSGVLGVMERHGLRPPRALLLLTRTLLTLEAPLRLIDPEFDLARPRPRSSSARRARVLGHAGGDPAPRAHPRAAGAAQSP